MDSANIKNTGLRGITIATTKISDVNGALGKLIYRGYLVKDLAENTTFEEVIYLLLYERLPGIDELEEFTKKINSESDLHDGIIQAMKIMPKDSLPMDVLQACISLLSNYEEDVTSKSRDIVTEMAIRLISKTSSIVATWQRIRNDE
ncbi:MAG: citrate (Si)-synthase, partial [Deltaproteobacteria bacterium]|nr:citrate (Si)-synthase [Deltaproteobacteria bacterium]